MGGDQCNNGGSERAECGNSEDWSAWGRCEGWSARGRTWKTLEGNRYSGYTAVTQQLHSGYTAVTWKTLEVIVSAESIRLPCSFTSSVS